MAYTSATTVVSEEDWGTTPGKDREMFHISIGVMRRLDSISSINILLGLKIGYHCCVNKEGTAASCKVLNSSHYMQHWWGGLQSHYCSPGSLLTPAKDTKPPRMKPHDQAIKSSGGKDKKNIFQLKFTPGIICGVHYRCLLPPYMPCCRKYAVYVCQ